MRARERGDGERDDGERDLSLWIASGATALALLATFVAWSAFEGSNAPEALQPPSFVAPAVPAVALVPTAMPPVAAFPSKEPSTPKGALVKRALQRRSGRGASAGSAKPAPLARERTLARRSEAAGGKVPVRFSAGRARALETFVVNAVRGVRIVDDGSARYDIALKLDVEVGRGAVSARCAATLSALPQRQLLASFSSEAAVTDDRTPRETLVAGATEACAASLAQDVSVWVRGR